MITIDVDNWVRWEDRDKAKNLPMDALKGSIMTKIVNHRDIADEELFKARFL